MERLIIQRLFVKWFSLKNKDFNLKVFRLSSKMIWHQNYLIVWGLVMIWIWVFSYWFKGLCWLLMGFWVLKMYFGVFCIQLRKKGRVDIFMYGSCLNQTLIMKLHWRICRRHEKRERIKRVGYNIQWVT